MIVPLSLLLCSTAQAWEISRRTVLSYASSAGAFVGSRPSLAQQPDVLPEAIRGYTALAPLGKSKTFDAKSTHLPLNEIKKRLTNDLVNGATGRGGYFLTGDLSTDLFQDDCLFLDPTNRVASLSKYQTALRILFDPSQSVVELVDPLIVNEADRTISGTIRSRGYLQLPWRPYVTAYESHIVYTVDESSGLISQQYQTWSKSASEALRESFTPSFFPQPLSGSTPGPIPANEPPEVTKLVEYLYGRRNYEYTTRERSEIDALVDIVASKAESQPFERELLPGTWILAYLQPGPEGGGIDRRVPFPEFPFNDSFQVFGMGDSSAALDGAPITNVGQLLGTLLEVRVEGSLSEADRSSSTVPKRLRADIQRGKICLGNKPKAIGSPDAACVPLPINGEGLFDSIYVGKRLRIGQNLNGGGARICQLRL